MKGNDNRDGLFKNVNTMGSELSLATDQQVSEVEAQLGSVFPPGYREYATALGDGEYADAIKVLMPAQVLSNLKSYRKLIDEFWSWDDGLQVMTKEQSLSSVEIAYSHYGDVLIFNPGNPDELFVLPSDCDQIFGVGRNLAEALEWMRTSPSVNLSAGGMTFKSSIAIQMEREAKMEEVRRLANKAKPGTEGVSLTISAESYLDEVSGERQ